VTSVADEVKSLAGRYGIVPRTDEAAFLARHVNRIEGVEGDEVLELIAELVIRGRLTKEEGYRLGLAHSRERHGLGDE